MGLKETRSKAIKCLEEGSAQAEERPDIEEKNLLKTGVVSAEEVITLLKYTRGDQYRTQAHGVIEGITIHIFEPEKEQVRWHIKLYFIDPNCFFISVHKSHIKGGGPWSSSKKVINQRRPVRRVKR